jgi:hypothetical protein
MGPTTELRRVLKARFFPYAAERAFVADLGRQPVSTTFRRRLGGRVQMFDLQWDKYGRPRFVLHFGTCPEDGLRVNGAVVPPDDTLPSWCPDAGSLQPRRGMSTRAHFRQDATMLQRLLGSPARRDPGEVVDELLAVFPELERYWADGHLGPHLRLWHAGGALDGHTSAR